MSKQAKKQRPEVVEATGEIKVNLSEHVFKVGRQVICQFIASQGGVQLLYQGQDDRGVYGFVKTNDTVTGQTKTHFAMVPWGTFYAHVEIIEQ